MPFSPVELRGIEVAERVASCFSLLGTIFIFLTFISSPDFRRPINRLVFYASWGNTLCNIGTLISTSGPQAGAGSHLCQFQGFLIEMFVPADAFWNLAMAFNVYLTLFKKYNAEQLKALEWRYHCLCYGIPMVLAVTCLCVETQGRGKIYGNAVLWCWISQDWDFLRVALCYGPAWVCIVVAFSIYLTSGAEIFKKRRELRAFNNSNGGPTDKTVPASTEESWANFKTTQIAVTSEVGTAVMPLGTIEECFHPHPASLSKAQQKRSPQVSMSGKIYEPYSVDIASPPKEGRPRLPQYTSASTSTTQAQKKRSAAMEANRAAWGYSKVALLFFFSLLITWVPSSAFRIFSLVHPKSDNLGLAYVAGIVLSLMGFWNSVIYFMTSRAATKDLIVTVFSRGNNHLRKNDISAIKGTMGATPFRKPSQRVSWGDDFERLSEHEQGVGHGSVGESTPSL